MRGTPIVYSQGSLIFSDSTATDSQPVRQEASPRVGPPSFGYLVQSIPRSCNRFTNLTVVSKFSFLQNLLRAPGLCTPTHFYADRVVNIYGLCSRYDNELGGGAVSDSRSIDIFPKERFSAY